MTKKELYYINHYLSKGIQFLSSEELVKLNLLLDKVDNQVKKRKV